MTGLLAGVVLMAGAPRADAAEVSEAANEGGIGVAAALTSLVYGPVKVVYALGGSVVAGCAWIFSAGDSEVATTVLTRAVRGTYVVTPGALRGETEIEFIGRSPVYRAARDTTNVDVSAPPDSGESVYGW
ncbi:MAG: hypothetical protein OSB70_06505 [Myxococcota bacterium]|nr:hypothetical protein [Myxococcota bacterium]